MWASPSPFRPKTVKTVVNQLRESGKVARGYIGVQIQPVTDDLASGLGLNEAQGALVAQVQADARPRRRASRAATSSPR